MHPIARSGYLDLLCLQWYESALKSDEEFLKVGSRLTDRQWEKYKGQIMEHFHKGPDGLLRQKRCAEERDKAINMLGGFRERMANARKHRWEKEEGSKDCSDDCQEKNKGLIESDHTGQDRTKENTPTSSQPPSSTPKKESLPFPSPEPEKVFPPSPEDDDPPGLYPRKPTTPSTDRRTTELGMFNPQIEGRVVSRVMYDRPRNFQRVGELLPAILNRIEKEMQ